MISEKIRVLVVEDNRWELDDLIEKLEKTNKVKVVATAKNDMDFLYEAAHNQSVQAIIFDDNLNSKRRGVQVYQQLIQKGIQKPAVIVSGEQDFEIWELLRMGICDFVQKPAEIPELNLVITKLIDKVHGNKYFRNPVQVEIENDVEILEAKDIIFVATDPNSKGKRDMSSLVYTKDRIFVSKTSISTYKLILKKYNFIDSGKSFCINPSFISDIDPDLQKIHLKHTNETASYSKQSIDENFKTILQEFVKLRESIPVI